MSNAFIDTSMEKKKTLSKKVCTNKTQSIEYQRIERRRKTWSEKLCTSKNQSIENQRKVREDKKMETI